MKRLHARLSCLGVIALCAAMAFPGAPRVLAEPGHPPAVATTGTPPIDWSQLGLSNRIELVGGNGPTDVLVPVPQGVSPTGLAGVIASKVNAAARVDVFDARENLLGSIEIPADVLSVPFVVNISAADVTAGVTKLSFAIRAGDTRTDNCASPPSVTLSQLTTTYSGPAANPRTVADFLPGYLDRIAIEIGPSPTRDQQQAALALVAKLTRLYRPMPVRIDVDTSAEPAPPADGVTQRTLAIRTGDQPGLVVENPDSPAAVLVISGTGEELLRQVDIFADRRFELAQNATASVTSVTRSAPRSSDSLTFGQLGMTAQASIVGTSTLYIGFDASAFGVGAVDHAKIHLMANYTPVTNGDASVVVRSGTVIVASTILDRTGVLDLSANLPVGAVTSNVGLALDIRYIPQQDCPPLYDRMSFAVNPDSTVTVRPGTDNRGGFPALPMAFTPDFDVALSSPDEIGFAAQAINLMAQQSTATLQPNVTTIDDAANRGSGLLVVATGDQMAKAGMNPPILLTGADTVDVTGAPVTGINLDGPLGVVQAFTQGKRMVLAINSSGGGPVVQRSLDYIRDLDSRWSSLTGDVVATGATGNTVNLAVHEGGWLTDPTPAKSGWKWWTVFTVAAGAVIVAGVLSVLAIQRRRARK